MYMYSVHIQVQTPPAAFVVFSTVYSQAMDALHLLMRVDGFEMVRSKNAQGVKQ